jgi:uncharacterized protein GlcG (DUF336 family)
LPRAEAREQPTGSGGCGRRRVRISKEALRITTKATELAVARGVSVAVAVVDAGGHLATLHRMGGVPFIAAEVAWGKAWTAAAWGGTPEEQGAKAAELPQFATAITVASGGRYTPQGATHPAAGDSDRRGRGQRHGQW